MRFLLDTHALLWWLSGDVRFGAPAREVVEDPRNDVLFSVVSLWEIAVKVRVNKLVADIDQIERALPRGGFTSLPITASHLSVLVGLPAHHRDPFDHLLVAQAHVEQAALITNDRVMSHYPIEVICCG